MPNNWKQSKLSEIANFNSKSLSNDDKFKEYLYFDTGSVTEGAYKSPAVYQRSELPSRAKRKVENNDIIISTVRPNQKHYGIIKNPQENLLVSTGFCVITAKDICNSHFLYFFLITDKKTKELHSIAEGSTTAYPSIKPSVIEGLMISLPPLPEQQAIASILSTIDDKIENNLAMNKTLEEMAMALYKHWFVYFGPFQEGKFVESELGDIPEGWEVKPIGDIIETIGGGTPSTKKEEYWKDGDIHWYSPTDLTKSDALFSIEPAKRITELGLKKSSAKLFPAKSLLMSSRATIGALSINLKEATTNQGFITMIPNEKLSVFQLYGWAKYNMDLIISKANGSTFKEISKTNFRAIPILLTKNIESYESRASEIFGLIENNIKENQTLIEQRDAMLPKLVSGEVRVKGFS